MKFPKPNSSNMDPDRDSSATRRGLPRAKRSQAPSERTTLNTTALQEGEKAA
ncbi:MAG: hypothetical protein ACXVB9_16695 [Bdellovibrionota bacterium]